MLRAYLLPKLAEAGVVFEVLDQHLRSQRQRADDFRAGNVSYRSHHVSRTQHVDPDCSSINDAAPLHCQTATELNHSCFRRVIDTGREPFVGNETTHRPNAQYRAGVLVLDHLSSAADSRKEHTAVVDAHHLEHFGLVLIPTQQRRHQRTSVIL